MSQMKRRLISAWCEWRKRKAVQRIRQELTFWGVDLNDLSDEDIEAGCIQLVRVMSNMGLTTKEVLLNLRRFNQCNAETS